MNLNRYLVTREDLEGLSYTLQNELLRSEVETLRGILITRKRRKEPEPESGDAAPGEQQPQARLLQQQQLAGYQPQQPPAAAAASTQQQQDICSSSIRPSSRRQDISSSCQRPNFLSSHSNKRQHLYFILLCIKNIQQHKTWRIYKYI
jgi:hypothetical protein